MKSLDDRFMKSLADAMGAFTLAALERNGDGTIPPAPGFRTAASDGRLEQAAGPANADRANAQERAPLGEAGTQAQRT